ncbi:MAG: hypothetical protein U0R18_00615 [Mycobacterium sp.]
MLAAIAAITGQTIEAATEMFSTITESAPNSGAASAQDISATVDRVCTRIGLAPALTRDERDHHIRALRALTSAAAATLTELNAWNQILRSAPESVPTLDRDPVVLAPMPDHQEAMWTTLLDFEEIGPPPWVLVGGQMTALHLAEHGIVVRLSALADIPPGPAPSRPRQLTELRTDPGSLQGPQFGPTTP